MSTPSGALSPYVIQGEVVRPDAILDPQSMPAHAFFNVVRELLHKVTFHNEAELDAALGSVDAFEKRFIPVQDRQHVVQEGDRAAKEDVTQRVAPRTGYAPAPAAPQLDYGMLARAILAAQREQEANDAQQPTPPVTPAE